MAKRSWDSMNETTLPLPDPNYMLNNTKDRDVEMWIPPSKILLNSELLDDYCKVARQHQKLNIDEALFLLYNNKYVIQDALIRLETCKSSLQKWTCEEIEIFNTNVDKGKNFYCMKKLLPNKSVKQIVDYYYRVKKTRCITIPNNFGCSHLTNICSEEENILERKDCENCVHNLFRFANKSVNKALCPACSLYFRIYKEHRPFVVNLLLTPPEFEELPATRTYPTLENEDKKNSTSLQTSENNLNSLETNEHKSNHPFCYFEKSYSKNLAQLEDWTKEEIFKCIDGFRLHGENYVEIAKELNNKNEYDVAMFYTANEPCLDYMINLFKRNRLKSQSPHELPNDIDGNKTNLQNAEPLKMPRKSGRRKKEDKKVLVEANNKIGIHRIRIEKSGYYTDDCADDINFKLTPMKSPRHSGGPTNASRNSGIQTRNQRKIQRQVVLTTTINSSQQN